MKYGFRVFILIGVFSAVMLSSRASYGQDIDLSTRNADQIWRGTRANEAAGFWLDEGAIGSGDSRRDLVIGAPGSSAFAGRVYVIFGGPVRSGEVSLGEAHVIVNGAEPGDQFGYSTATGNVTNPEGSQVRNLLVGAPGYGGGRGAVFVFAPGLAHGSTVEATSATLVVIGRPGDRLGTDLASGDLNGDGYREIIMGAPGADRVYVVNGGSALSATRDLAVQNADITISGGGNAHIGDVIATGDVTGDGRYDLLLGAPESNMVLLLLGRATSLPSSLDMPYQADATFVGIDADDGSGSSLRIADLDSDGRRDLVIGAPRGDGPSNARTDAGEVYVLWGGPALTSRSLGAADVTFYGPGPGYRAGSYLAAGDINRDTPNDLVIVAQGGGAGGAGELLVYYGRARSRFGSAGSDGRRIVDLSIAGQTDRRILGDANTGALWGAQVFEVTGEGARDITAGAPNTADGAGAVFFTISPKLRVSPAGTLNLTVGEGRSTSAAIEVQNPSVTGITWEADTATSWIGLSPLSGSSAENSPGNVTVMTSAASLGVGTHAGMISVASTSAHLEMTLQIPVSLAVVQTRFLQLEAPASGAVDPPFTIRGWAIDTAVSAGTGVDAVDLYAYPTSGAGPILLGRAMYGEARSSVGSLYGSRYTNSGFSLEVTAMPAGTFSLVAMARTSDLGVFWTKGPATTVSVEGVPSGEDMDGDSKADLLWQHVTDGWVLAWLMDGTVRISSALMSPGREDDLNWKVVGTGDADGDGKLDIYFHHAVDGRLMIWRMDRTTRLSTIAVTPGQVADTNWRVEAVADFSGDGRPDLLWRHQIEGWLLLWTMNGGTRTASALLSPNRVADTAWQIAGTGDFDGDGRTDIFWQHQTEGWLIIWRMDGATRLGSLAVTPGRLDDPTWRVIGIADVNGDGKMDLLWQHMVDGWLLAWLMDGPNRIASTRMQPAQVSDLSWKVVGPR